MGEVYIKYKFMNKKVKQVPSPLLEASWRRMKGVATDPSLRDLRHIKSSTK